MTILDMLFKKSPFGPIIEHSKKVQECIELINPVIKAWLREDWDEIERLRYEISRKENEADKLKISIRSGLPKSLFYPVPRGDLLRILSNQDNSVHSCTHLLCKEPATLCIGVKIGHAARTFIKSHRPQYIQKIPGASHCHIH